MADDPRTPRLPFSTPGAVAEIFRRDQIDLLYHQYFDRYYPDESIDPPRSNTENNLPGFLELFILSQNRNPHPYDSENVIFQMYVILDSLKIQNAHGEDLNNIGAILNQPRPFQNEACYMEFEDTANNIAGFPFEDLANGQEGCPWLSPLDPVETETTVADPAYRRALQCVAWKSFLLPGNLATIYSMVQTIYILLKRPSRSTFMPSDISISDVGGDSAHKMITIANLGMIDDEDRALMTFVNPDGTYIWSKMAGLSITFSPDFNPTP